jgi:hypothetical protein
VLNSILGAEGQYTGEDISESGVQQGLRNEARGERDFGVGQEDRANQLGLALSGQYQNLSNDALGIGRTARIDAESDRAYGTDYDRNAANLGLALSGQYQGLGESAFNNAQSLRNEARTERGAEQDFALNNLSANQGILSSLAGLEGQRFGQEGQLRDEARGERAYGDSRSDMQTDRNVQQTQLEEDLLNGDTNRQNQLIQLLSAAGGDPNTLAQFLTAIGSNREAAGGSLLDTAGQILGRTSSAPAPTEPLGSTPSVPSAKPLTLGNGTQKLGRIGPTTYNRDRLPMNLDLRRILPATAAR